MGARMGQRRSDGDGEGVENTMPQAKRNRCGTTVGAECAVVVSGAEVGKQRWGGSPAGWQGRWDGLHGALALALARHATLSNPT